MYFQYYQLMNQIFEKCNNINKHNIKFNIIKVNSHKGIPGNEMADKLAKEASTLAYECKYGDSKVVKYRMFNNPINVDISKDMKRLRRKHKKEKRARWIEEKKKFDDLHDSFEVKQEYMYKGDLLFQKMMINNRLEITKIDSKMLNELKYLNRKESEIICKLRTERINLNGYLYHVNKHNDGTCQHCSYGNFSAAETVSHFLIDCPGFTNQALIKLHKRAVNYNIVRNRLRRNLRKLDPFFRQPINFTIQNILFPHMWQIQPSYDDKDRKKKLQKNLEKRANILKVVARFVIESHKFDSEHPM